LDLREEEVTGRWGKYYKDDKIKENKVSRSGRCMGEMK
jgi:hypothetical protein